MKYELWGKHIGNLNWVEIGEFPDEEAVNNYKRECGGDYVSFFWKIKNGRRDSFTYVIMPGEQVERLMDWAEENGVEWDIHNAEEYFHDMPNNCEFGLRTWPENWEAIADGTVE